MCRTGHGESRGQHAHAGEWSLPVNYSGQGQLVQDQCGFSGGRAVVHRTVNLGDGGSIPPTAVSKFKQFRSPHICLCLSEETLKASGPSIWCLCQGK